METMTLKIRTLLADGVQHVHGWSLAAEHVSHFESHFAAFSTAESSGTIVVLDFAGIESTSVSYVKRLLIWLLIAGERFADDDLEHSEGPPALNVYPVVSNLAPDVREEFVTVLEHARKACFEAVAFEGARIRSVRIAGSLDAHLTQTLRHVTEAGETSAPVLHDRYRREKIGVTAWNNRLNELYRRRLVDRNKQGRQLMFRAFAKEIVDG